MEDHVPIYDLGDLRPQFPEDDSHWIAPGAQVIGNVRLGRAASIWFGAVLRGDSELIDIGAESNIQDGCVLHVDPGFPLTLGERCSLGHGAIVHGCTIGEGTLIGMGATVMNGAVIGAGSLVGAGALVPEGREFPARSLIVGAPARRIRTLTDADVARVARTAAGYVARMARYKAGLREIG
jgi:carbonic anhydrase/acetyltransferase-like protein (isoleucine patch superfamily)